ncbi:unnamed protein product [Rhizophagus irregularis]|nr:unnamed protein product [Rhizophagus irregularis]
MTKSNEVPSNDQIKMENYRYLFSQPQSGVNDPPSHMTGDRIISQQTSQYTTNNYDWIVPLLHDSRITNASNFYVRVETISLSGIFGVTPSSGGTHGPISRDLPE